MSRKRLVVLAVLVALALASVGTLMNQGPQDKTIVATFSRTISLYQGAKVKVLGVDVGRVKSVKVVGTSVQVTMTYSGDVSLPADVHAFIVPPSIVGDRFVQLSPAYRTGPKLADGATLALNRTGVPVELDDNYRALDELARGLGPNGANRKGAVSDLVRETAAQLSGRGALFNQTIQQLAAAITTLADGSADYNKTIANVDVISRTLVGKDAAVRRLVLNLANVASALNTQGSGMRTAVSTLRSALGDLGRFTRANGPAITTTIHQLGQTVETLDSYSKAIGAALRLAPVGLTSQGNILQPQNWDPARPWATPVGGRVGSLALHDPTLNNLDVTLGHALGALCASMTPAQQAQLSGLCQALALTGGDLGSVLLAVGSGGTTPPSNPLTLAQLLKASR